MIHQVEAVLKAELEHLGETKVANAMKYSLFSEGKRLRPLVLLSMLQDFRVDIQHGIYEACALECIHTYSLIHDDLPALDNDDLRRFKPTNHRVFGEDFAILAGDGLLTLAFSILSKSHYVQKTLPILANGAGALGMIKGQEIDIRNNISSFNELEYCYQLKTGCLFASALEMATVVSEKKHKRSLANKLGLLLGVAFQCQDDLLELTSQTEEIGKSNQSDLNRNKITIGTFLSIEKAQEKTEDYFSQINALLVELECQGGELEKLIQKIARRRI